MAKTKKICMLVHNCYSRDPRVRREAKALIECGYSVDVIALKEQEGQVRYALDGVTVYQLPVRKTRESMLCYLYAYLAVFFSGAFLLTFLYAKNRYSLIQIHNMPNFIVFTALIPKLFGAKVLLDIHDPMPELFMSKFSVTEESLFIRILRFEEKLSMRYADRVITATEMVRERLLQTLNHGKDVDVILNLPDKGKINSDAFSERVREDGKFTLLYHGTIAKRHGLGLVVQALPEIKKQIPNVQFVIIGNGEYTDELKDLVRRLNLNNTVVFRDPVPHEQIAAEILSSNAVICVPPQDIFIEMALSTKILETLVLRKPVIISRNRCNEYYFKDDEVLFVDPSNLDNIVAAVRQIYELNQKNEKMASSIYSRILEKFNWDVEKVKYEKIVGELFV